MRTNCLDKLMFAILLVGMLWCAGMAHAQTAITAEKADIALFQEKFGVGYNNAAGFVAFSLTYDGAGTAVTSCISTAGDSIEIWIDSVRISTIGFPAASNRGLNVTAYFAAGNTVADLVAKFDALTDFTCVIGTHMPPWTNSATKIAAIASKAISKTALTDLLGAYMIATSATPATNECVISRGHKTYQTFGSGTGYFDIRQWKAGESNVLLYRYPCATTTAQTKLNTEFRVDGTRGWKVYYIIDLSAVAANATDYLYSNYSVLRR